MPSFTLRFKVLLASLLLFAAIGGLLYNQITLNSRINTVLEYSGRVLNQGQKIIDLSIKVASPSPTLIPKSTPVVTKTATKSATIIKR